MTLDQLCILANAGFTKADINAFLSQTVQPQTAPPQSAPPQSAPPQSAPPQSVPPQPVPPQPVQPQPVPPQPVPQTVQPQTTQSQALDVLQYLNRSLDRFEVPPERTASQVLEERYIEQTSGQSYADWLKSMKGDVK